MDGVLTDFNSAAYETLGRRLQTNDDLSKEDWKKISDAGKDFWSKMKWMPGGRKLWKYLEDKEPTILTAPSEDKSSIAGKKEWLARELPEAKFIIEANKTKYAGPDTLLIDDRRENIDKWREAGGEALTYRNADDAIEQLSKKFKKSKEAYEQTYKTHPVIIDPFDAIVQKAVSELGGAFKDVDVVKLEPTCTGDRLAWVTNTDLFKGKPGKQRVIHLCLKKIKDSFEKSHGTPYRLGDPKQTQNMKDTIKQFLRDVVIPHETEHIHQEMKHKGKFGPASEQKAEHAENWKGLEEMGYRIKKAVESLDAIAEGLEQAGKIKEAYEIDVISNTIEAGMMDPMTVRGIKILWDGLKNDFVEFIPRLKELLKRNKLSYSSDHTWVEKQIKNITGREFAITPDFF